MQANTMNLFGISFILVSCLASLCVQPALANWPVFSIEKGGTAVVPCVPKGDETAYFWSKGEDFATSQSVASRVLGIPSSDSEKYSVNENGSLVIYNVTLAEGGRYHCRIVSENTNCRGAVTIEVTIEVNDKSSARWIIPLVLLIVAIVVIVFLLKIIHEKRGKYAQKKKSRESERETLLANERKLESTRKALTEQLAEKNEALKSTRKALTEQLAEKDEALKEKEKEIITVKSELTAKEGKLKTTTEKLKKQLADKDEALKNATRELTQVKDDLDKKTTKLTNTTADLKKITDNLDNKTTKLTTATEEFQRKLTEKDDAVKTATEVLKQKFSGKDDAVKDDAEG